MSPQMIATLKREYEPMRGRKITAARARQLMNILDKLDDKNLNLLAKQNIPFVSSGSRSKLAVRNMKFKVTNINPFKEEVTQEDFDLEEGKMKTIATMFDDGKSAEEIAKALKLPVATVKGILGEVKEEQLHEFKKMTVTFKSMDDMSKASTDLAKQGFTINAKGTVMKVDGKGADLNKYATDLKNNYGATVRAESYSIDESADEDFYNPIYEACWVGYKKVGMKKKGDKMVPNCVPESVNEEEDDSVKLKNQLDQKDNEIAQLKQNSQNVSKTKGKEKLEKKTKIHQGKEKEKNENEEW
jgi:hypothetical protein